MALQMWHSGMIGDGCEQSRSTSSVTISDSQQAYTVVKLMMLSPSLRCYLTTLTHHAGEATLPKTFLSNAIFVNTLRDDLCIWTVTLQANMCSVCMQYSGHRTGLPVRRFGENINMVCHAVTIRVISNIHSSPELRSSRLSGDW